MQFKRFELKYYISDLHITQLRKQLTQLMQLDKNSPNPDGYIVRSLYFDSHDDECLYQKQSGFLIRKKIRLRTYGAGHSDIAKFEIKRKNGQQVRKDSVDVSRADAEAVCEGNYGVLLKHNNPVLNEIYTTFATGAYRPKVIVEYRRVALTLPVSNIRVTFDLDLASNINHIDLFSNVENSMPVVLEKKQIMEVKFDDFFPNYLKRVISSIHAERMAISKYTLARRFHKTQKWEDN